ncbi:MAG: TonB-dependent receptor [Acidimicrobiia bacterium]|nr:TonB-dependent receptor [Acidimicrobiia bacterium]
MGRLVRTLAALAGVVFIPSIVFAQAAMSGTARDASGAVLPGVTVEAASPVLIEKVRAVTTDGNGQYRIVDLRPGAYTVTFTLPGFNTFKRDGIELTGSLTAVVDAELRVGALEETITVTGEAPLVDVQSVTKQAVLSSEIVNAIPSGRNYYTLGVLIPGVNSSSNDVGGNLGDTMGSLTAHGSKAGDQRITQNGATVMTLQTGGGNIGGSVPNVAAAAEVTVDSGGASADLATGGVRVNFIPRDGGNTFRGNAFVTYANEDMTSSNLTQRLRDRGLALVNNIKENWDVNPGFGGPIRRDKLWYYVTTRYQVAKNYSAGMFHNRNAFLPNVWTYEPDLSKPALSLDGDWEDAQIRVTWQASSKHKFAGTWDQNWYCRCPNSVSATLSPEAANDRRFPVQRLLHGEWWSPLTNRVLAEVVAFHRTERWGNMHLRTASGGGSIGTSRGNFDHITDSLFASYPSLIGVTEQSTGLRYHGPDGTFNNTWVPNYFVRGAVSYVTGSHTIKVGWNDTWGFRVARTYDLNPIQYRFNNGVPNQITIRATPYTQRDELHHDMGVYAQDRWTIGRMTLNGALRFDWFYNTYPDQQLGPAPLVPNRNFTLPGEPNLNWKDLTFRSGWAYDLNGDGKTALKVGFNKFLAGQALGGIASNTNPVGRLVLNTTRSWTDANRNFVPDCDLTLPAGNGECGPMASSAFGTSQSSEVRDRDLREGFGKRQYNYELSFGVQREILPRVSADVAFFRRWYGNFTVTDDLNLSPADFDVFSISAPRNSLLPDGGGQTLNGIYNLKPAVFGRPQNNKVTLSDNYGKQLEHWNGFDVNLQARMDNGLLLRGGVGTGSRMTDNCEIVERLPEMLLSAQNLGDANNNVWLPAQWCHQEEPWRAQWKGVGIYTIPRVEVQIAGTFQSIPGGLRPANYNLSSAEAARTLGRPLAGNVANITVNVAEPGQAYGERINQLDLRFGKILRFGRTRSNVSLDVFNALNVDAVTAQNNNYATLWRPTTILQSRFFKVSAQVDF